MNLLLTGATGYIGKALLAKLTGDGHTIRALVRKSSDVSALEGIGGVELFEGDLTKEQSLKGIEEDIDAVYHLAVQASLEDGHDEHQYYRVNEIGSLNLLRQFTNSRLEKFLFTTTSAALGPLKQEKITEQDFSQPATEYGKSKHLAEIALKRYADQKGIPLVIARLTHVYGPGEMRDYYRIVKMIKRGIFPQVGFGANLWPAVYIDDAVDGLIRVLEHGTAGEMYIISDRVSHNTRDIRRYTRQFLGIKTRVYPFVPKYFALAVFSITDGIGKITGIKLPVMKKNIDYLCAGRVFSIEKARKELGFEPKVRLKAGIEKTINYYLEKELL